MNKYSVSYTTKKADYAQPKKAYGRVQINEVMEQHPFSHHMATHNNKYNRGDILPPSLAIPSVLSPGAVALMYSLCIQYLARRRG